MQTVPNNQISISNFMLLRERSRVNEMYSKSFNIGATTNNVRSIENILNRYNSFSELNMATIAPDLIKLSPVGSFIEVPYGWNQDRVSFILTVIVKESNTKNSIYFITGYSDYFDSSRNIAFKANPSLNDLDPNITFHINSITHIEELFLSTTNQPVYKFVDEITLIAGKDDAITRDECLIRPVDIMGKISEYGISTILTSEATEVTKKHINPLSYMSNIVGIIKDSSNLQNNDYSDTEFGMMNGVRDMVTIAENLETPMMECPFLLALYRTLENPTTKPTSFKLHHLTNIFGKDQVNAVTKLALFDNIKDDVEKYRRLQVDNILTSEQLENNLQPTVENMLAMEFYYIMSTIMFKHKITQGIFKLSNHPNFTLQPVGITLHGESYFHKMFANPETFNKLDSYLKNVVLNKLAKKGDYYININIDADIDLLGKSTIAVTYESEEPRVFRYNSSMDNNFTPLVTTTGSMENLTNEVSVIIDTIYNTSLY